MLKNAEDIKMFVMAVMIIAICLICFFCFAAAKSASQDSAEEDDLQAKTFDSLKKGKSNDKSKL